MIKQYSDFSRSSVSDFFLYLKASWISSLLFSNFVLCISLIVMTSLNYLQSMIVFMSAFGFGVLIWVVVICLVSLPYFFPFDARSKGSFVISMKKLIFMFVDNVVFTFGLLMCFNHFGNIHIFLFCNSWNWNAPSLV
jgi:hypothetical protein